LDLLLKAEKENKLSSFDHLAQCQFILFAKQSAAAAGAELLKTLNNQYTHEKF
jgi:hypothetical protein